MCASVNSSFLDSSAESHEKLEIDWQLISRVTGWERGFIYSVWYEYHVTLVSFLPFSRVKFSDTVMNEEVAGHIRFLGWELQSTVKNRAVGGGVASNVPCHWDRWTILKRTTYCSCLYDASVDHSSKECLILRAVARDTGRWKFEISKFKVLRLK